MCIYVIYVYICVFFAHVFQPVTCQQTQQLGTLAMAEGWTQRGTPSRTLDPPADAVPGVM